MIEIVRHHSRRVKRWQHGEMALRWTAAGMVAAEAQFRRVKGYRQLPQLLAALEQATADLPAGNSLDRRRRLTLRCDITRRSPTQLGFDNSVIESFWSRMQVELLDRRRWKTRVVLANATFDYIEIFYNRQGRLKRPGLGIRTRLEFETARPEPITAA